MRISTVVLGLRSESFQHCSEYAAFVSELDIISLYPLATSVDARPKSISSLLGSDDTSRVEEIRDGIKVFSEWPTIPQLYVKGEFIGGCDIVKEMFDTGELSQLFDEKEIPHSKKG